MTTQEQKRKTRVTCAPSLAPYLKQELEALGFDCLSMDKTGVETLATTTEAMRLNLRLRTAFHVLQRFADINCRNADELYSEAKRLPWDRVIDSAGFLSISSNVRNETITNSMFPNMRLKDAICDKLVQVGGKRPDAGSSTDGMVVNLHWVDNKARIYLNMTGRKLSDRGYRKMPFMAPMRETIAASVLMEMNYDGSRPLVVPMCGSGTIAIEAALMAKQRAPGLLRSNYSCNHWLHADKNAWSQERADAKKIMVKNDPATIIATDIEPEAIEASKKNAVTAGVDHLIDFHICDFSETPMPDEVGDVVLHGEYGIRLGEDADLIQTYKRIGDYLKTNCAGWDGYVFTSGKPLIGAVRLKVSKRTPFINAEIDCRLLRYELYKGSKVTEASSN
ncbi:MAG TPA: class I SAM-dependent RNA methyltransferase [Phycisphaerales bacterium]|nr:class I SAM-dependent RNA methyltransferase [Phycisphaerales bacterium]HIN83541.1 class I SAM-dependent RNA methyltransferase [Phycisphaerales bacterium]HIO53110.1 class I SAM-dependent RNA methyltransferase [Phycisphaerales bacterium]